jgi:hypothetical protein
MQEESQLGFYRIIACTIFGCEFLKLFKANLGYANNTGFFANLFGEQRKDDTNQME